MLPFTGSLVAVTYIPTVWPQERERIRKTQKKLENLESDSTDIWKENWFNKYVKRPADLENVNFAQFISGYYKNNNEDYVKQQVKKIIRYKNYDFGKDFNEYRREMVTLHIPFRNEDEEILSELKLVNTYMDNEHLIMQRRKEIEHDLDLKKTIEICKKLYREAEDDSKEVYGDTTRLPDYNIYDQ